MLSWQLRFLTRVLKSACILFIVSLFLGTSVRATEILWVVPNTQIGGTSTYVSGTFVYDRTTTTVSNIALSLIKNGVTYNSLIAGQNTQSTNATSLFFMTSNTGGALGVYTTSGSLNIRNPFPDSPTIFTTSGFAVGYCGQVNIDGRCVTFQTGNNSGFISTLNVVITGYIPSDYYNSLNNSSSSSTSSTTDQSTVPTGQSVTLSSLGSSKSLALSGGTLVLNSGDNSGVALFVGSAGGTIQSTANSSVTLSGSVSGPGGLVFSGTGATTLAGQNTYSGGTTVSSGTLSVAGDSPTGTGDVSVGAAGTLMGTGVIAGNITVLGVLKPGNSPGYLAASSNVSMSAGSTYQQDIAGLVQASRTTPVGATGYYSLLSVGGQFTINNSATLVPRLSNLFTPNEPGYGSSVFVPALGDRFQIIAADGGVTGRFSRITQPAELTSGTQFVAFYGVNNNNSVVLATAPTSYANYLSGGSSNVSSSAAVLDQLLSANKAGTSSSTQESLLYSATAQTAQSLPSFARALSGESAAASVAALPMATQRLQQTVLARLGDASTSLGSVTGLNNALQSGVNSTTHAAAIPTANMSSNPLASAVDINLVNAAGLNANAWGEIAYQRANRSNNNNSGTGFNSNLYQAVFGYDTYVNAEQGLKLGGGFALSNTNVAATGGSSTIQQGSLFVYGKMPVLENYLLDAIASVGLSSSSLSRDDPTGLSGGFNNKSVMGNDALLSIGVSRAFDLEELRVTPFARLTYQYVGQAAYDEGNSAAALAVARFNGSAGRGTLGLMVGSLNKNPLSDPYTFRASAAVGADTNGLMNPTLNTTLGGFSSTVTTANAGSVFVQAGLYGTVKVADQAYAYASLGGEARNGQTLYGGSVGVRIAF